jgi:tellurite resistance protein TerC
MDFLFQDFLATPVWFWLAFIGLVIALTAFDLGVLHKEDREMGISESLKLSVFYIAIAMAFGVWVYFHKTAALGAAAGADLAMKYYTGYFIEKALSIDNVFVISLIFTYFAIPRKYQYRALLWGIVAVIILRGIMIAAGAALVEQFEWVLYIFAAFLIATGIKMLFTGDSEMDVSKNPIIKFMSKHMRVTKTLHGERFFVSEKDEKTGKMVRAATPLFLALVVINLADLVFAVDSVPAIFAITTDTFIVYTSNIMAILAFGHFILRWRQWSTASNI